MKFPAKEWTYVLLGVCIKNRPWKIRSQKCIKSHQSHFCQGVSHFQYTAVGKEGASLHRDHWGSAACRSCLPSPLQAALGSLSWRCSASCHALHPTSPTMTPQGRSGEGEFVLAVLLQSHIYLQGTEELLVFLDVRDAGPASQDGKDGLKEWECVDQAVCRERYDRELCFALNPGQRAQQSRNLSE